MKLSLKRRSEKIELETETGEFVEYEIRELSASEREQWMNDAAERTADEKKRNFRGFFSKLLSYALYDQNGKAVAANVIDAMPATTVEALYERALVVSRLKEEEIQAVKNA